VDAGNRLGFGSGAVQVELDLWEKGCVCVWESVLILDAVWSLLFLVVSHFSFEFVSSMAYV
jgi:hypothetical protein